MKKKMLENWLIGSKVMQDLRLTVQETGIVVHQWQASKQALI